MRVLYLSYDGILEPLGASQVVSYLERLADTYAITLLSYEKRCDLRDRPRRQAMATRLKVVGIRWIRLRYHKRPSLAATGYDVLIGLLVGILVCRQGRVRLVHARGYVASVIAHSLKRLCGVKFLFDLRGFWPEEKVDAGQWTRTALAYRLAKRWERTFFHEADAIVSLTAEGVRAFATLGYRVAATTSVEIIPTCADLRRFSPGPKDPQLMDRLGLGGATVAGSTGTLSTWYLRGPTLRYLAQIARELSDVKVLLVTRDDHAALRRDALAAGIPPHRLVITAADFDAMPAYVRLMDVGVFFIKACFSKKASAPTKLAEFLGTGVPVVINDGIGDSGAIVREHGVGVVLSDTHEAIGEASLPKVTALLRDPERIIRCRRVAERFFDLDVGVQRYDALYGQLLGSASRAVPQPAAGVPSPLGVA